MSVVEYWKAMPTIEQHQRQGLRQIDDALVRLAARYKRCDCLECSIADSTYRFLQGMACEIERQLERYS